MSLRLLIDEDSQAKYLVSLLKSVGHSVLTVNEVGIASFPDAEVLEYARKHHCILLTRNCNDFQALHEMTPIHPGILAIYEDANPAKNIAIRFEL